MWLQTITEKWDQRKLRFKLSGSSQSIKVWSVKAFGSVHIFLFVLCYILAQVKAELNPSDPVLKSIIISLLMRSLGQDFRVYVRSLYKVIKLHPTCLCKSKLSLLKYEC